MSAALETLGSASGVEPERQDLSELQREVQGTTQTVNPADTQVRGDRLLSLLF